MTLTQPESGASAKRDDSSWFYTREVAPGVWVVAEPQHVYSWLIAGRDRAVLLDTGMGMLPIRPVAESLTPQPISVVNTHYHFDHVGGNWEFDEIAIHERGAPFIQQGVPRDVLDAYLEYADRQLDAAARVRPIDREFLWVLCAESEPRPLPPAWDPGSWTIRPTTATQTLRHGDTIDLGGRELTVIDGPGHSPDGICLFEAREGLLFGGDTINVGPIYAHFPDSNLDDLASSARRLADLGDDVRLIMACHYGRAVADRELLPEIANGLEAVRDGSVVPSRAVDILGGPMLEARFEHFSVTLPDPDAPEVALTTGS
jgi:glyoxylase-like metal-dependent hydrolase (beta-lactamase superfamily II)